MVMGDHVSSSPHARCSLELLLSDGYFLETPVDSMKIQLEEAFEKLVGNMAKPTTAGIVHLDGESLEKHLLEDIPWESILKDLEDPPSQNVTRFDLLVDFFAKAQTTFRRHCPSTAVVVLAKVWCFMPDHADHRGRIIKVLDNILDSVPSLRSASRITETLRKAWFADSPFAVQNASHVAAARRIVSYWFRRFPEHRLVWLRVLFLLVIETDHVIEQENASLNQDDQTSDYVTQKRKRTCPFNMQYLHGELSDDEAERYENRVKRSKISRWHCRPTTLSLAVPHKNQIDLLWRCQTQTMLTVLQSSKNLCTVAQPIVPLPANMRDTILATLVNACSFSACRASPTIHYCAVMLQNELQGGYANNALYTIQIAWEYATTGIDSKLCLDLYTTIINEASVFDSPEHLESACSLLLEEVVSFPDNPPFREAWTAILARRGRLMDYGFGDQCRSLLSASLHGDPMRVALRSIECTKPQTTITFRDAVAKHTPSALDNPALISIHSPNNAVPRNAIRLSESNLELVERIDDDSLSRILSFLNYKRLIRVRTVCSRWQSLADRNLLWRPLYLHRFPSTHVQFASWKNAFVDRYTAEKAIRGRICRSSKRWKVQLCPHCLTVLATPNQAERHFKTSHGAKSKKSKAAEETS